MRKIYIKPEMNGEKFITNEYVSACYIAKCVYYGDKFYSCKWQLTIKGNTQQEAINNYLSANNGGDASLHPGSEDHKVGFGFPINPTYEESDKYYHKPNMGYDHEMTFERDKSKQNHS